MAYTNVLHTKQLLCYWRCAFSGSKVHVSYDWQVTAPNTQHNLFLILHFMRTFKNNLNTIGHITRKLYGVYECFAYQTAAVLLEMFFFSFRAVCELRLVSYGPKYATRSLSDTPFCTYYYE